MDKYFYIKNPWWEDRILETGISRASYVNEVIKNFHHPLIHILTGLRRVGKSTIVLQVIKSLINEKQINPQKILFFSIEEPSLADRNIADIINDFRTEKSIRTKEKIYVFIDEIQFKQGWEQEIKSLYDTENIKFVLTGSSTLLIAEKISYLTGRYLKTAVFPLSFEEYLSFRKKDITTIRRADDHLYLKYVQDYLQIGGMPEYVLRKPDRYLQTTVESILFKDLVTKFQIRNPSILQDLIYLLSDRVGFTAGSLKISHILEINKDTILAYINYLHRSFITAELENFSTSRNKQIYNPSKIYFTDNGILKVYSSKPNFGALAENAVFNKLYNSILNTERAKLGYWYENKYEVDFILDVKNEQYVFESKWIDKKEEFDLTAINNMLNYLKPKKIFLLTRSLEGKISLKNVELEMIPLYKFLLLDINRKIFSERI